MNAQPEYIVPFLIGILLGVLVTLVYYEGFENPGVTCPSYKCELSTRNAESQIIGDNFCQGEKGIFTGTDKCTINIKNIEEKQGAFFTLNLACKTLDNLEPQILPNKQYLGPQETKSFSSTYNVGGKEWSCDVQNVIGETVDSCLLKQQ